MREIQTKNHKIMHEARIPDDNQRDHLFKTKERIFWSDKTSCLIYINKKGSLYYWNWLNRGLRLLLPLRENEDSLVDCLAYITKKNYIAFSIIDSKFLFLKKVDEASSKIEKIRLGNSSRIIQMEYSKSMNCLIIMFEKSTELVMLDLSTEKFLNCDLSKPMNQRKSPILSFSYEYGLLIVSDAIGDVYLFKENSNNHCFDLLMLKNVSSFGITSCRTFKMSNGQFGGCGFSYDNTLYLWEYKGSNFQTTLLNKEKLGISDSSMTYEELIATKLNMTDHLQVSDNCEVLLTSISFLRKDNSKFLTKQIQRCFKIDYSRLNKSPLSIIRLPRQKMIEMMPNSEEMFTIGEGYLFFLKNKLYYFDYSTSTYNQVCDLARVFSQTDLSPEGYFGTCSYYQKTQNILWVISGVLSFNRRKLWVLLGVDLNSMKHIYSEIFCESSYVSFFGDLSSQTGPPLIGSLDKSLRKFVIKDIEKYQPEGTNSLIWSTNKESPFYEFRFSVTAVYPVYVLERIYILFVTSKRSVYISENPQVSKPARKNHQHLEISSSSYTELLLCLSSSEDVLMVEYLQEKEANHSYGYILTNARIFFFDSRFKLMKTSILSGNRKVSSLGFWEGVVLFQDSKGVFIDSPGNEDPPICVVSKGNSDEQYVDFYQDRAFKICKFDAKAIETRCCSFDFIELVAQNILCYIKLDGYYKIESFSESAKATLFYGLLESCKLLWEYSISSSSFKGIMKIFDLYPLLGNVVDAKREHTVEENLNFHTEIGDIQGIMNNLGLYCFKNQQAFLNYINLELSTDPRYSYIVSLISHILVTSDNFESFIQWRDKLSDLKLSPNLEHYLKSKCIQSKLIRYDEHLGTRLKQLVKPFGEARYKIINQAGYQFSLIDKESIKGYFGYSKIKGVSLTALKKELSKELSSDSESINDSIEEEPFKCLLFLWRFDKIENNLIQDFGESNINGLYSGNDQLIPQEFKEGENPMENEDKWGSSVPPQNYITLNEGYLKTAHKRWTKRLKNITFEIWFNPSKDVGVLFSDSNNDLLIGFKKSKIFVIAGGSRLKLSSKNSKIKLSTWTHLAFTYSKQTSSFTLYSCGARISSSESLYLSLDSWHRSYLIFCPSFTGSVSEMRCWNRVRTPTEIADEYRSPLSIVSDKCNKMVIKLKENGWEEQSQEAEENAWEINFGRFEGFSLEESERKEEDAEREMIYKWNFGGAEEGNDLEARGGCGDERAHDSEQNDGVGVVNNPEDRIEIEDPELDYQIRERGVNQPIEDFNRNIKIQVVQNDDLENENEFKHEEILIYSSNEDSNVVKTTINAREVDEYSEEVKVSRANQSIVDNSVTVDIKAENPIKNYEEEEVVLANTLEQNGIKDSFQERFSKQSSAENSFLFKIENPERESPSAVWQTASRATPQDSEKIRSDFSFSFGDSDNQEVPQHKPFDFGVDWSQRDQDPDCDFHEETARTTTDKQYEPVFKQYGFTACDESENAESVHDKIQCLLKRGLSIQTLDELYLQIQSLVEKSAGEEALSEQNNQIINEVLMIVTSLKNIQENPNSYPDIDFVLTIVKMNLTSKFLKSTILYHIAYILYNYPESARDSQNKLRDLLNFIRKNGFKIGLNSSHINNYKKMLTVPNMSNFRIVNN